MRLPFTLRHRALREGVMRRWNVQQFDEAASLVALALQDGVKGAWIALSAARLHGHGLLPFETAHGALRECAERGGPAGARCRFELMNTVWTRQGATDEALALARGVARRIAPPHWRLRAAALIHDAGHADEALEHYGALRRRPGFGLYPNGYVRLAADAARRKLDRAQTAMAALRIDDRLRADDGAAIAAMGRAAASIAVLGNGPLASAAEKDDPIDDYACVVRINARGAGHPSPPLGTRTDVWLRPAPREVVKFVPPAASHIVFTGGNIAARFSRGVKLLEPYLDAPATLTEVPPALYHALFAHLGAVPSAGLVAIAMARLAREDGTLDPVDRLWSGADLPDTPPRAYGFAPRANTRSSSTHRGGLVTGKTPNRHEWEGEARLIERLVRCNAPVTAAAPGR